MYTQAVQLVGDLVKTRNCVCPDEVLEALSDLKFPTINLAKGDRLGISFGIAMHDCIFSATALTIIG